MFCVKMENGEKLNERYLEEYGFKIPILVDDKFGLDMKVPDDDISVGDIVNIIGILLLLLLLLQCNPNYTCIFRS